MFSQENTFFLDEISIMCAKWIGFIHDLATYPYPASCFTSRQSNEMVKRCWSKFPQVEMRLGNLMSIPYMDGPLTL
ncbi:hypothetical protein [Paenibacillus terrae]|uniref:hypothetical protein n=1 Tax=Paenibacillus terrae TaxID=159743 RepID=UPI001BAF3FEA